METEESLGRSMADGDELSTFKKFEPYLNRVKEMSVFRELHGGNKVILAVRGGSGKQMGGDPETRRDQFLVMWYDGPTGHARAFVGTVPDVRAEAGSRTPEVSGETTPREKADVYLYRKKKSGTLGDRVMVPAGLVGDGLDCIMHVQHPSAILGDDVRVGRGSSFSPESANQPVSAPGPTMSAEVYRHFWEALGDQDDFAFVLLDMPVSKQPEIL